MKKQAERKQSATKWIKDEKEPGLYRYGETYYARVKAKGKQKTRSLHTHDRALARRLLAQLRSELEQLDQSVADPSLAALCERFEKTFLGQKPKTVIGKIWKLERVVKWWPPKSPTLVDKIKASDVDAFMDNARRYSKSFGPTSHNEWVSFLKALFESAVRDRLTLPPGPAAHLKWKKREKPIRRTPSFEQFQAIVAKIRAQKFSDTAEESADFIEFLGLAGLGQAEASALTWGDVDWSHNTITTFRHKTRTGFQIPLYPQLRPLLEKRFGKGKLDREPIFRVRSTKKALIAACKRLVGFPSFSHRAFRRMFITRAIEKGIDVKVIAEWQGHKDGGKLILDTYSEVRKVHSQRMAQLMTTEEPENIVRMPSEKAS
ncbi:MAG TPA: tyrosine-type recombinase/integrase [Candidatus Udaeobacter sp.]|nr:tyrosine-type recombinase/integrase [Candidatus Udaeobacter sp.]